MFMLFYFFLSIFVLSLIISYFVNFSKNNITKKILTVVAIIFTEYINYVSFTSEPTNNHLGRFIAIALALLPLIPIVLFFMRKLSIKVFRMLTSAILILCMVYLIFLSPAFPLIDLNEESPDSIYAKSIDNTIHTIKDI